MIRRIMLENAVFGKTLQRVLFFVIVGLVRFQMVLADEGTRITNPIGSDTFQALAGNIAKQLAIIAPTIGILFIVIGGLQYVFAGDSEEKVKKAHKTLTWALIGTAVVIGAEILVYAVVNTSKKL